MYDEEVGAPQWRDRMAVAFDKAEIIYLRILRGMILLIATVLIGYAIWLAVSSIYKMSRSPDSVVESPAIVTADDVTAEPVKAAETSNPSEPTATAAQREYYAGFVNRYYGLFRARFEPFRQSDDKQLSKDEFDDAFIHSQVRLNAIAKGDLNHDQDRADLESLLGVMSEAAKKPETRQRLRQYQTAKKVRVEKKVQRTRPEYRSGWDSLSTACPNWYYSPIGCPTTRAVQVPYTETIYAMEFPQGTRSHSDIFRSYQDRFFQLLSDRRDANASQAQSERDRIAAQRAEGSISMGTALQVFAAFLALMFFFLLIAIERHQRRISAA